ncbi:hypothetical protein N8494_01675, partial [bacterium]|nr:hypothetical protein [bacterium]
MGALNDAICYDQELTRRPVAKFLVQGFIPVLGEITVNPFLLGLDSLVSRFEVQHHRNSAIRTVELTDIVSGYGLETHDAGVKIV